MRVQVTIPGTVESYCIDERGDKRVATDELWLETYLCSVLRAYAYADDGSGDTIRKIMGVRRFNPVTNTETEHKFLQAAEQLFFRGMRICTGQVHLDPKLTPLRMATWIGLNCSGPKQRLKSSHHWPPEIFPYNWTICFRYQLVRKAPNKEY